MDFNVVVLSGRLSAPPEIREFDAGTNLARFLVTVRSDSPRRRVDVVPVTLWQPDHDHPMLEADVGTPVWVAGTVQRRFWTHEGSRISRLEIVATEVRTADHIGQDGFSEIVELAVDGRGPLSSRVPRCEESQ